MYETLPVQIKMVILSRRLILLAILLYEQSIYLKRINLRPNLQFLSTQPYTYQLYLVTTWFDSVCVIATRWVNFREIHLHEYNLQLFDYNV